jgi:hypothetical protein
MMAHIHIIIIILCSTSNAAQEYVNKVLGMFIIEFTLPHPKHLNFIFFSTKYLAIHGLEEFVKGPRHGADSVPNPKPSGDGL